MTHFDTMNYLISVFLQWPKLLMQLLLLTSAGIVILPRALRVRFGYWFVLFGVAQSIAYVAIFISGACMVPSSQHAAGITMPLYWHEAYQLTLLAFILGGPASGWFLWNAGRGVFSIKSRQRSFVARTLVIAIGIYIGVIWFKHLAPARQDIIARNKADVVERIEAVRSTDEKTRLYAELFPRRFVAQLVRGNFLWETGRGSDAASFYQGALACEDAPSNDHLAFARQRLKQIQVRGIP